MHSRDLNDQCVAAAYSKLNSHLGHARSRELWAVHSKAESQPMWLPQRFKEIDALAPSLGLPVQVPAHSAPQSHRTGDLFQQRHWTTSSIPSMLFSPAADSNACSPTCAAQRTSSTNPKSPSPAPPPKTVAQVCRQRNGVHVHMQSIRM